jgi:AcrR family transcriptional regulator
MSELMTAGRRRRADAERSIGAILDAAAHVLGERPDASMDDIARTAGVSRQTVYAHFTSRDALINSLYERMTARVVAAVDAAHLDRGPPTEALLRLLQVGWDVFEGEPFTLQVAIPPTSAEQERDRHQLVLGQLERLIRRGQRAGEFDGRLPVGWLTSATLALAHAAGEEVRVGRMSSKQAFAALQRSLLRLYAGEPSARCSPQAQPP